MSMINGKKTFFIGLQGKQGDPGKDGSAVPLGETAGTAYDGAKGAANAAAIEELKRNGAGGNTTDTKVTLTVTDGYQLDIRSFYRYDDTHCGCTLVDWGDGTSTEIVGKTDDEMKHNYAVGGTYTITFVGITTIPAMAFRQKGVSAVTIGSTVTHLGNMAFDANPDLKEVTVHAEIPPEVIPSPNGAIVSIFTIGVVKNIYVPNVSYFSADRWSEWYSDVLRANYVKKEDLIPQDIRDQVNQNTADIAELKAESAGGNTTDTKVTLTVTDGYQLDIRDIYRRENRSGCTFIDWGDGTSTEIVGKTDDEMKHNYAVGGTYTITLVGITNIEIEFRAKNVCSVEIGSTVERIRGLAFTENPNLTEVTMHGTTPPTIWATTSTGSNIPFDTLVVKSIYVPETAIASYVSAWRDSSAAYSKLESDKLIAMFKTRGLMTNAFSDKIVTVGEAGDFPTINKAIEYLSWFYPIYKKGGMKCEIKILDGTIINEQIIVERLDLSYISITTDNVNNTVTVTATTENWDKNTLTHDTRGNVPFFSGEFGARLPVIKCLFSATSPTVTLDGSAIGIVGYYCNRGSMGVIAGTVDTSEVRANIGFEGFYDNVIANNNSEIVLREAVSRNAARYGVMSRHISRVSARSADITNCAECAAYTDRASMMDVRHADLSGSKNGIQCYNASIMTANETKINNATNIAVDSQTGSVVNCRSITISSTSKAFVVLEGGQIVAASAAVSNAAVIYNVTQNTLTAAGVIYV